MLNEILSIIQDARIVNLYHMSDDSIVLKLRSGSFAGELRIAPGKALYIVEGSYEKPKELSQKGQKLRSLIANSVITGAEIIEGERIIIFNLKKGHLNLRLVCEFLPKGTVAVLDEENRILASLHRLEMKDRRIAEGEVYKLPPAKPAPSAENLKDIIGKLTPRKSMVSALAAEAGFGGRYAEEILHLAAVDPSKKVRDLSREEIERILKASEKLTELIREGPPVVAYSPEGGVQPLPYPMESLKAKGWRYEIAGSLNEAFRITYERELAQAIEAEKHRAVEEKIKELERRAHEKRFSAQRILRESLDIRRIAEKLFQYSSDLESLKEKPGTHKIGELTVSVNERRGRMRLEIGETELEFDLRESLMKQISNLFDKAKKSSQAAQKLLSEAEGLEKKIRRLQEASRKELEESLLQVSARIKKREGKWYERYRWFITSEGFLAVAGKDASSNISLLKKHLEPRDLIFHAEVRGAAAVILKNGQESGAISRQEAAQFAAVYSRAWRDRIMAMTVYYVTRDQVSFTPPPGHYLPKGGFVIKGERTYLTAKLELAIGFSKDLEILYGPPSAVAKKADKFVKIIPGNKRAEELADEIAGKLLKGFDLEPRRLRDIKLEISELIPYGKGALSPL